MTAFIHDDFLLHSDAARQLYHDYAAGEPILDFHNHLSPAQIANDHHCTDLAELWLAEDHYKWRALRANGVPERCITGDASPREKYDAWAATVPHTLRNPLHHWTALELKRTFDIDIPLGPDTADAIWNEASARLPEFGTHALLTRQNVAALCTTDDPADSLEDHQRIAASDLSTRVYPTFRPDCVFDLSDPVAHRAYCNRLGAAARQGEPSRYDDLLNALECRHADFHALGCRLSDHSFPCAPADPCTLTEARTIYAKVRDGQSASPEEQAGFAALLMLELGRWDARRGWTKQLHLGALRNNHARAHREIGPNTGYDSIGDARQAEPLARYLSSLAETKELPQVVVYNLNPVDSYVVATMLGNFQSGPTAGKIQYGAAWWFLDQQQGMIDQLNTLSNTGLLSRFVGMLTDSRSFLSFSRHEYFRRILCNLLGGEMERGDLPNDFALVGDLVRRVSFANARDYFRLELDPSYTN